MEKERREKRQYQGNKEKIIKQIIEDQKKMKSDSNFKVTQSLRNRTSNASKSQSVENKQNF